MILSRYLLGTTTIFYLLPLLVLSGIGMGIVTGIVLKAVMPYINRLNLK